MPIRRPAKYLKKIIEANTKYPHGAKSWLVFHEGLYKIDQLLTDMLRKDRNMEGPWPKLVGFIDKTSFKVAPVEQPPANPKLAKETQGDYNTEGFTRLAAKMQSAGGPAEQAKSLLPGLIHAFPQPHSGRRDQGPYQRHFSTRTAFRNSDQPGFTEYGERQSNSR